MSSEPQFDAMIHNHGSITLIEPLSVAAKQWLDENTDKHERQQWVNSLVVEPRYLADIVQGMLRGGLTIGTGLNETGGPARPA